MIESRLLINSSSFGETADNWAKLRGLMDPDGSPSSTFPVVIGIADGETTMGSFQYGLIQTGRTIKGALQDLEYELTNRLSKVNNLSEIVNKITARANLQLGTAATASVGTSGAVVPLLNIANTWTGRQNFSGAIGSVSTVDIIGSPGALSLLGLYSNSTQRWAVFKDDSTESGSNTGSNFNIGRYSDAGTWLENALSINRASGVVSLAKPLPLTSGGTGYTTLAQLKSGLGLDQVNNTPDSAKPVSTAMQAALDLKANASGQTFTGPVSVPANFTVRASGATEGGEIRLQIGPSQGLSGELAIDTQGNSFRVFDSGQGTRLFNCDLVSGILTLNNNTFYNTGNAASIPVSTAVQTALNSKANTSQPTFNGVVTSQGTGLAAGVRLFNTSAQRDWRVLQRDNGYFSISDESAGAERLSINTGGLVSCSAGLSVGGGDVNISNNLYANNGALYAHSANFLIGKTPGTTRSAILRNDGGAWYFMISDASAGFNGQWNSLRPITIDMATGWTTIGNGATINGNLVNQGTGTFNSTVQINAALSVGGGTTSNEYYTPGWFRPTGNSGIFWEGRGRGITVSDNGGSYGNINVYGTGLNGWQGYSIGAAGAFMASGNEVGIYRPSSGGWLVRFDANADAWFAANVVAYSDERLKDNIRPIDNVTKRREGMAKAAIIYEIDGLTHIGFGAQTLEPHVPEVVRTDKDPSETKSVVYAEMIAILAVDNQNLSDALESEKLARINLENKYTALEQRLAAAGL